ncbi:hypothetical protein C8A03DRAFT_38604 [Achaetomium macrosporum]|uniref:Ryanodine receptor Ryr domain-containing protein n=1 Tax=Achaetomium macrosporum TaxID=79813 RepID=A0AAN7H7A3_9PEZI|nr:hypothetical protein C8A03DRAFT_38604 [Achaetomium macrosporum]
MPPSKHLLIAGQAAPNLFRFESIATPGLETRPPHSEWFRGGVGLLTHLLEGSARRAGVRMYSPDFHTRSELIPSSLIELSQRHDSDAYAVALVRELNLDTELWMPRSLPPPGSKDDRTVYVFHDGENHFDGVGDASKDALKLFEQGWPSYFIYHMSRPLCEGAVWEKVRPRASGIDRFDPDCLVVIVQAEDLRAAGIELSHGLSWEKTCEDFVKNIGAVGSLVTLVTCPHLIVVFGCDGLIYHRGLDVLKPVLFFHPLPNEHVNYVPGFMEAFIAGFARTLMESAEVLGYEDCIKAGFRAGRRLGRKGLLPEKPVYDALAIMTEGTSEDALIRFDIPSDDIGKGEQNWSLLDSVVAEYGEVARRIVLEGISKIGIPLARINRLILFDRRQIQQFQVLISDLEEYLAVPQMKPLSIALFGPRGCGKTFAAQQVTELAAGGRKVKPLSFDLCEFTRLEDLVEAFHQIRDCSLGGYVTLAYFKNFDAALLGSPFGWLPHLLPAMANGRFFDGAISRPVGPALLFFGTSATKSFAAFHGLAETSPSQVNIRAMQDFITSLHGYVDMAGFNRGGLGDRLYLLQRAVVLRALLEERAPGLKSGDGINIDEMVLRGLLLVPEYSRGIRSLESVLAMSRLNHARHFSRSALPSKSQLQLHVDYGEFKKAMSGRILPTEVRDLLAEQLHNTYCRHIRERERAKPGNESKTDKEIDEENWLTPWSQLKEDFKDSNKDHADAIPSTLRIVDCFLAERKEGREPVEEFTSEEIEKMAKQEKARWNSERLQRQWRTGPRSGKDKTTPYLVPWEDLEEPIKDIDRAMVRSYTKILPPNYAIYRLRFRA